MNNYWDRPIIITGCARSGTSLVAGIFHHCGAWMGQCTGPTRWNKKGQFENEFIRDQMTKPFLKSIGADPLGQDPLPQSDWRISNIAQGSSWREKLEEALKDQGYLGDRIWAFKGAKACLIWPIWERAFPQAQWVIVRREDSKIVDSCMKTSFMRKRTSRESWQQWIDHHKQVFDNMEFSGLRVRTIWPDKILASGNLDRFRYLIDDLGLVWNDKAVNDFVEPRLLH